MTDLKSRLKIPYKSLVLCVLDGFGVNPKNLESTWRYANRPNFEEIEANYPFTTLIASGVAVGLPWGEEGNSEVGHLTMGAGRAIYNHLPRISNALQDKSFFQNPALLEAVKRVKEPGLTLHFIGLFSSGSVHAYIDHLYGLLDLAKENGLSSIYLHLFTDGRDAPPDEARKFLEQLEERLFLKYPFAKIASIVGRNFAMDRDEHWDRIESAYRLFTEGKGNIFKRASEYVKGRYEKGITDEFIEPGALIDENKQLTGRIKNGDSLIFFNFREDSMRELVSAFTLNDFDKFSREKLDLLCVTMTEYDRRFPVLTAFPPLIVEYPLARIVSEAGLKQLHIAETEKYAHVAYFFNGGKEKPFLNEERILIPSPKTAHFDETPEMSAEKICEMVIRSLDKYDFILVNFANGDMVGHTGNFEATVKAIEALDGAVGKLKRAILEKNGALVITSDHGNAEEKIYIQTARPRTKHTANPVPFYLVAKDTKREEGRPENEIEAKYRKTEGTLSDIASTILELLKLKIPAEMTGRSLLEKLS